MEVFHYCAAQLEGTPLFESCTDAELFAIKRNEKRQGAVYNDYDGIADELLTDFEDGVCYSNSSAQEEEEEEERLTFSQREVDLYFLGADDRNDKRWEKDHPFFTTDEDEAPAMVRQLMRLSDDEWRKLLNHEDIKRLVNLQTFGIFLFLLCIENIGFSVPYQIYLSNAIGALVEK